MADTIDTSIIFKGLAFIAKPTADFIGRQIVGKKIHKRRQLQKKALAPILQQAAEDIAEIIEPVGKANLDQICLFLTSGEAEAIVRQIYATSILETQEQDLAQISLTFLKAFSIYTNIGEDELKDSASQIFEILVGGCEKALLKAIDLGILSAHEAKSQFRFKVLYAEIEAMNKNLEFLSSSHKLVCVRCLEFISPSVQIVRKIVTLVIKKCIEIGRISFENRYSDCRPRLRHRVATGGLLNNLVKANEVLSVDGLQRISI